MATSPERQAAEQNEGFTPTTGGWTLVYDISVGGMVLLIFALLFAAMLSSATEDKVSQPLPPTQPSGNVATP